MGFEDVSVENVCFEGKFEFVSPRADKSDRFALGIDRILRCVDDVDTFDARKQPGHFLFYRKVFAAANRFPEKFLLLEYFDFQTFLGQVHGRERPPGPPPTTMTSYLRPDKGL